MKPNPYSTLLTLVVGIGFFIGGLAIGNVVHFGGIGAVVAPLAQIIPGVHRYELDYDIPTVSDLSPIATFWQVREKIKNQFVYPVDDDTKLTYGAIRGMLAALEDPYTRFLDPKEFKDFNTETEGHFDGIGAILEARIDPASHRQRVIITRVIERGPTSKTKIRGGDEIIGVDDKPIKGLTLTEVVRRIRGKRGTVVELKLVREGLDEPFDVEITRANVDLPTVEFEMLDEENKIGYIWLRTFNKTAKDKMVEAITKLNSQGMKALLFDLSGDPGGILDAAVAVGSFFLDGGPVVHIKGRGTEPHPLNATPGVKVPNDVPIVVLIDRGSASASEIVAGALQERHRATIVGRRSFGKSKVQTILEMRDGSALFLSTAVYLTPKLTDIGVDDANGDRGVKPDHMFPEPDPEKDAEVTGEEWHGRQIQKALEILKTEMKP